MFLEIKYISFIYYLKSKILLTMSEQTKYQENKKQLDFKIYNNKKYKINGI